MIQTLISRHLLANQWEPAHSPATPVGSLRVDRVAPVSVAGKAGVQAGDWLVLVDGDPAADVDFVGFVEPDARHQYEFYSPARKQRGTVQATGALLGVSLSGSTETLERAILTRSGNPFEQMLLLWERGAWDVLEACAARFVNPRDLEGGFFRRLLGGRSAPPTPAVLLLGAALYERGQRDRGMKVIHQFVERHWTTAFMGVRRYYLGRDALGRGNREKARALLEEAFQYHPSDRIAELSQELTGQRPALHRKSIQKRAFPIDYHLPQERGEKMISFAETLRGMSEDQLLILCLLGGYRANGPYHDFMRFYRRLSVHFADHLAPMHVITEDVERNYGKPEFIKRWLRAENEARHERIPFRVLDDRKGKVNAAVAPKVSPHIVVVNARGTVVHEGPIDEVQWWDLLATARANDSPGG